MKTLQFIDALNFDATTKNYLMTGNISDIAITNIEILKEAKTGKITGYKFLEITDFYLIEQIELAPHQLFANEIFRNFNNNKNAVASILYVIENKKALFDAELFAQQHNKSPKFEGWKEIKSFAQLWNRLTEEQKETFAQKSKIWADAEGLDEHEFESFYILPEKSELVTGAFIKIKNPMTNKNDYGKIVQASPRGFVTIYNGDTTYTLSSSVVPFVSVIEAEQLPANAKEALEGDAIDWFMADCQDRREKGLNKGQKTFDAKILADEKAEAKAQKEADAKAKAEQSTLINGRLKDINLTTTEKINKFAELLNAKRNLLNKADFKALADKLRDAKAQSKAEAKAKAEAEKQAKAEAKAEAKAKAEADKKAKAEAPAPAEAEAPAETKKPRAKRPAKETIK